MSEDTLDDGYNEYCESGDTSFDPANFDSKVEEAKETGMREATPEEVLAHIDEALADMGDSGAPATSTEVATEEPVTTAITAETEEVVTEQEAPVEEVAEEKPPIIRTNLGVFTIGQSPAWGKFLQPCADPEAKQIDKDMLEKIFLNPDFPKLPAHLWARIVRLYFYFCDSNNKTVDEKTEVSVLFLRKEPELTEWRVLVPTQEVGAASVDAKFEKCCDIVTGEEVVGFPPPGWVHAGSSHSHQTMGAFFSGVDDKNELSVPGMHIVVGKIHDGTKHRDSDGKPTRSSYEMKCSIVLRNRRFIVDYDQVIDATPTAVAFHTNVLKYVTKKSYSYSSSSSHDSGRFGFSRHSSSSSSSKESSSKVTEFEKTYGKGWGDWDYQGGYYDSTDDDDSGVLYTGRRYKRDTKTATPTQTQTRDQQDKTPVLIDPWEKLDKRNQRKMKLLKDLLDDLSYRGETYEAVFDLLAEYVG
jgi:hypothetical protein